MSVAPDITPHEDSIRWCPSVRTSLPHLRRLYHALLAGDEQQVIEVALYAARDAEVSRRHLAVTFDLVIAQKNELTKLRQHVRTDA